MKQAFDEEKKNKILVIFESDFGKNTWIWLIPALSNPVAIRHVWRQTIYMWRQEVFAKAVKKSTKLLLCSIFL